MMKHVATLLIALTLGLIGCERTPTGDQASPATQQAMPPPTNRVDIPAPVRKNLGITFAKVERRAVARTLRLPGRFELLPTAVREYRTPVGGRIELLVNQYQKVQVGTPLYQVDSAAWRDLHEELAATQARVDSMKPLREAHRLHEKSLTEKVQIWEARVRQLTELRTLGGGGASQLTDARATLNATQAELADTMEKDAELQADEQVALAQLRSLQSRRDRLVSSAGGPAGVNADPNGSSLAPDVYTVRAAAPGVVETLHITQGGLAEESGLVMTIIQPEKLRFRATALQTDLGRLREGLPSRVVPGAGTSTAIESSVPGMLSIGVRANADERTVDLLLTPDAPTTWAQSGVTAHLEVTLEGGTQELAIPLSCLSRDGAKPIIFRRDPANPDKAIRMEADIGINDGRWVVIASGVKEGDEIVLDGVYQLALATSATPSKAGHFHSDGTFHEGEDK